MTEPTERAVRNRAGWIGVEISKSRVRTPGKPGYGLYRLRGSRRVRIADGPGIAPSGGTWRIEQTNWTGYLFMLEEIDTALTDAMDGPRATPAKPGDLLLHWRADEENGWRHVVPTRWTSAYRGPRTGNHPWGPINATGPTTVHGRRKAANREFQAEHLPARAAGLRARHEGKLSRKNER